MLLMAKRSISGDCQFILSNGCSSFNTEEGKFVGNISVVNVWTKKVGCKERLLLYVTFYINLVREIHLRWFSDRFHMIPCSDLLLWDVLNIMH